jgi:transcriptional regulator with XRE-family HTH domain
VVQHRPLIDDFEARLGRRLHQLRRQRRLSLHEVSAETGISASFISHIENGKSDMTIGRLVRLATFYGVSVEDVLPRHVGDDAAVIRRGEHDRIHSEAESLDVFLLAPDQRRTCVPYLTEYEPGGAMAEHIAYPGEAFAYVLEGELALSFQGGETLVLQAGDTACFDPSRPHRWACSVDGPGRLLTCTASDSLPQPPT